MPIYEDDPPPGRKLLLQFKSETGESRVSLTESLLAAIADELHHLNQLILDRNL